MVNRDLYPLQNPDPVVGQERGSGGGGGHLTCLSPNLTLLVSGVGLGTFVSFYPLPSFKRHLHLSYTYVVTERYFGDGTVEGEVPDGRVLPPFLLITGLTHIFLKSLSVNRGCSLFASMTR